MLMATAMATALGRAGLLMRRDRNHSAASAASFQIARRRQVRTVTPTKTSNKTSSTKQHVARTKIWAPTEGAARSRPFLRRGALLIRPALLRLAFAGIAVSPTIHSLSRTVQSLENNP